MEWNDQKVLLNIRIAQEDDLLDRVTAYRAGMEPDAIAMIEQELHRRGVSARQIAEYREACERECIFYADGTAKKCVHCNRPAVIEAWGWHRLLGRIPILPRRMRYCRNHRRGVS